MDIFKDRKTQLILLASFILALLIYFVGIDSYSSTLTKDQANYATVQQKLTGLNSTVQQYEGVAGKKVAIINSLKNFEAMVPQQLEFGVVITQLASLALQTGVTITAQSISAAPTSATGGTASASSLTVPTLFSFTVTGPYSNYVTQFLPALYNGSPSFPRLLIVNTVDIPYGSLSPSGTLIPPSTVTASITATIFSAPTVTPVASS